MFHKADIYGRGTRAHVTAEVHISRNVGVKARRRAGATNTATHYCVADGYAEPESQGAFPANPLDQGIREGA